MFVEKLSHRCFLFLFFTFLSPAFADSNIKTNNIIFGLGYRIIEISHFEESAASSFQSLSKKNSMSVFSLKTGLEKEFFADKPLSFTAQVFGGVLYGRKKEELAVRNLDLYDKVQGQFYGLGGTLNFNMGWYKKNRAQLFGGLNFVKSKIDYKLEYQPINAVVPKFNIDYAEDGTQAFLVGGCRFFDLKQELYSIFTLEYQVASSFTFNQSAFKINDANAGSATKATVEHIPFAVTLGFGMMF